MSDCGPRYLPKVFDAFFTTRRHCGYRHRFASSRSSLSKATAAILRFKAATILKITALLFAFFYRYPRPTMPHWPSGADLTRQSPHSSAPGRNKRTLE